ncbi:MAG: hypothetical protein QHH09_00265 [Microgenomates group bacterium]|nr:hypothetical protein [Microgenomates group bacterium]
MKKLFFIIFLLFFFLVNYVEAERMESSGYRIEYSNLNIGAANLSDDEANQYKLSTTLGQAASGKFQKDSYLVRAGFQYIHSIVPFTFSISKININFGELQPNVPKTDSAVLKVSFGGAGKYQVTAAEEGPLKTLANNFIEDASCDDKKCDEHTPSPWVSNSTIGFGYNLTGEDIPEAFIACGPTCYRRFPDVSNISQEKPVVVMSNESITANQPEATTKDIYHEAVVTFKVNVSAIQPAGTYQTIITFVATPTY